MDQFLGFISSCFHKVPTSISIGLLLLFLFGTCLLFALKGVTNGTTWSMRLLLAEYCLWILFVTVLFRHQQGLRSFNFAPFWSYRAYKAGTDYLLTQIISNVVAFIPIGILLGKSFPNIKWWIVLLIGGAFSLLIEILQYFLKRGFAEFDDVWHNAMGCMLGYGVYVGMGYLVKKVKKGR